MKRPTLILLATLLPIVLQVRLSWAAPPEFPTEVRVGISVYEGLSQEGGNAAEPTAYSSRWPQLNKALKSDKVRFKLAAGTPAEIYNWIQQDRIDLAVVSTAIARQLEAQAERGDFQRWVPLVVNLPNSMVALIQPKFAGSKSVQQLFSELASVPSSESNQTPATVLNLAAGSSATNPFLTRGAEAVTVEDLAASLVNYRCTQDRPIRLAVVFSGGGAKCAFQVGAIRALEEKLATLRERLADPSFDISLVVGTSGGALNAVPVAMALSSTAEGWADIAATWGALDQRELIRPSPIVRANMVLWFVCVQGLLLLRIRRRRHFNNPERFPWIISRHVILIGAGEVLLARLPFKPWSLLGTSSLLHHFWLWLTWGLEGSGWTLIVLGLLSWILRHVPHVHLTPFHLRYRYVRRAFWAGIVLLPTVQAITILFFQPTLSDSVGIENAVTNNFGKLVNSQLSRERQTPIELAESPTISPTSPSTLSALQNFSQEVLKRGIVKRDLVLTGSALPTDSTEVGADLYFYLPGSRSDTSNNSAPQFGSRGVSLAAHPALFMDAMISSGAIYPIFPPRTLVDVPRKGDLSEVVDGSFEHRSPIEAAVLWGATHIILIQAATDEIVPRGAFLENINAALNHLYDQAQLLDLHSREQVETFTLTPRPPHIGLLDFSDNLIQSAIGKGYVEAMGRQLPAAPSAWRKEISSPLFWAPDNRSKLRYCSGPKLD